MGLAASQARFLGLTARKSNVEYEGQQVNQQRTALAQEVNALYNKLASMSLPVAPDASQFYQSNYAFETTDGSYVVKNYYKNADGTYYLNTEQTREKTVAEGKNVIASTITKDGDTYKYTPVGGEEQVLTIVTDPQKSNMRTTINDTYGKNTITEDDELYSYRDKDGETHYFSKAQMDKASAGEINKLPYYTAANKTVTETKVFEAAGVEFDSKNRISKIKIDDQTVDVSTVKTYDSDGYDAALRDYTMSKDEYNKRVQELNAETESLQQEDKILEMRLDQISTEQNELKTELEAVKSILKDNIEKTFNTFS